MQTETLNDRQRQIRRDVRNFLLIADSDQLRREIEIRLSRGDHFRAECVRELIEEGRD